VVERYPLGVVQEPSQQPKQMYAEEKVCLLPLLPKIPNVVEECAKKVHSCAHAHHLECVGRYVHVERE
jgi:hypothetical protein